MAPIFFGMITFPTSVAIAEFAIEKVQIPGDDDAGSIKFSVATLSLAIEISEKVPSVFGRPKIVSVVLVSAPNQFVLADCTAVIVTKPAS